jgi:hypothetical protein
MLNRVNLCDGYLPGAATHDRVTAVCDRCVCDRVVDVFLQSGLDFSAKSVPFCALIYGDTVHSRLISPIPRFKDLS